jgi:uncharacterized RDD family membrane protein YckC
MAYPAQTISSSLASRTNRLLGQFADGVVGAAPLLVAALVTGASNRLGSLIFMAGVLWSIFYYLFADGLHGGQSFGKQWLGMQVIDAKTGRPCTFGQSFVRNLLLAVLGPIDWIFIFGDRHQRLGDKAAGTIVIAD